MTRTAVYQITGVGIIGDKEEDVRDLDLIVEVESELCPRDPEVGYFEEYWSPSEDQAEDDAFHEALKVMRELKKYDDYDIGVEFIEYR